MKTAFLKIFSILKSKYTIATICLLGWLVFFDKNDLVSQLNLSKKTKILNEEKQYYLSEIEKNKTDLKELMTNPKNLEKFAREKYLMKRDNEDVFVIAQKKSPNQPKAGTNN